ncbi:MAG: response regulator [Clostridiales bacterium]|nr:response regulator [Clostridiales bacterium]
MPKKKRVLVICGDPRLLAEIKAAIMRDFDVSIASGSPASPGETDLNNADAVVLPVCGADKAAFVISQRINQKAREKNIPVLFLAERDDAGDERAAFAMGASDYCVRRKDGGASALVSRLNLRISERLPLRGEENKLSPNSVLAGKSILIAEDVEINRELIGAMLSDIKGLTLVFACDGREAVEKFSSAPGKFSLILMDIHMPGTDGLEAAREIRRLTCQNARAIPIVALTANTGGEDVALLLEAGMNGFLQKPVDYETLLNTITEYCAIVAYS